MADAIKFCRSVSSTVELRSCMGVSNSPEGLMSSSGSLSSEHLAFDGLSLEALAVYFILI